jgi:trimeric autotransporter adhesin
MNRRNYAFLLTGIVTSFFSLDGYSQANTTLSNLVAPTAINQSLLPNTANTRDLGSATRRWRLFYFDSAIYMKTILTIHARGTGNFFAGQQAGNLTLTGNSNSAFGQLALNKLTSGVNNAAIGYRSLFATTTGNSNTAAGREAAANTTTGSFNVAVGFQSMFSNTIGGYNVVAGFQAAYFNKTGANNVAIGPKALMKNVAGNYLVAIGDSALFANTSGYGNTALGSKSLYQNTNGRLNTAVGFRALISNITGTENTAVGGSSMEINTGAYNTAVGSFAGYYSSINSTFIGWDTYGMPNAINSTALGYHAPTTASYQVRLGDQTVTSIGGAVGFSTISDGRFKENVKENVPGLDFVNQLRPVTYTFNAVSYDRALSSISKRPGDQNEMSETDRAAAESKSKIVYTGFIAQEVEATAKKMNFDFSGVDAPKNEKDFYGLRYADFVVPLVKAVQELSRKNDSLEEKIASMEALLKQYVTGAAVSNATLDQNVPNPVKNRTAIGYNLPDHFSNAQIQITDAAGKLLKRITLPSGTGRGVLNLDAYNLAAGTYHYILLVDGRQVDAKKMVVTK